MVNLLSTPFGEWPIVQCANMAVRNQKLKEWADKHGYGPTDLAAKLGRSPSFWSDRLGKRAIGEKLAREIEDKIGKVRYWLDQEDWERAGNTAPGPAVRGKVPLISSVTAGEMTDATDLHAPGVEEDWIDTTVPIHRHTYALRVSGDSMEPDFPEGCCIIVEPELDPHPGDFVIAKNGADSVNFKQLIRDGSDWYLKPLNPRYPLRPLEGSHIIGVVRELVRRFR